MKKTSLLSRPSFGRRVDIHKTSLDDGRLVSVVFSVRTGSGKPETTTVEPTAFVSALSRAIASPGVEMWTPESPFGSEYVIMCRGDMVRIAFDRDPFDTVDLRVADADALMAGIVA